MCVYEPLRSVWINMTFILRNQRNKCRYLSTHECVHLWAFTKHTWEMDNERLCSYADFDIRRLIDVYENKTKQSQTDKKKKSRSQLILMKNKKMVVDWLWIRLGISLCVCFFYQHNSHINTLIFFGRVFVKFKAKNMIDWCWHYSEIYRYQTK